MDMKLSPPLLDALLEGSSSAGVNTNYSLLLQQLKESLRRDLMNLFNSRQSAFTPPEPNEQLVSSLLNYGLPDLMSVNLNSHKESRNLCRAIELAILRFEPRISSAKVSVKGAPDALEPNFYFRIEVVLNIALADELIIFDSALNPVTQNVDVKEVAHYE